MAHALEFQELQILGMARVLRVRALWRLVLWRRVPEALVGMAGDRTEAPLPEAQTAAWLAAVRDLHGIGAGEAAEQGEAQALQAYEQAVKSRDEQPARLDLAHQLLGLDPPQQWLVDVVAVTQLDPTCAQAARILAYRLQRPGPTDADWLDEVLAMGGAGVGVARLGCHLAQAGGEAGPLLRGGILAREANQLSVTPTLLSFLLPDRAVPSPLQPHRADSLLPTALRDSFAELRLPTLEGLERALTSDRPVLISGGHGFGGSALVESLAAVRGLGVRSLHSSALFDLETARPTPLWPILRAEARLFPALWVLDGLQVLEKALREQIERVRPFLDTLLELQRPIVLVHEGPVAPDIASAFAGEAGIGHLEVIALSLAERQLLVDAAFQLAGLDAEQAHPLAVQASSFSLGVEQVARSAAHAMQRALTRSAGLAGAGGGVPTSLDLRIACTTAMTSRLRQYGSRVDTAATWDDLVLAAEPLAQVRNLARFARVRERLFGEYGFGERSNYGRALSAMFSGPSGTGKTMVAGLIAKELGIELYRVDLSRVVSKYIGETEERIGSLFSEATQVGAALLFDEADSLFGQRTEIKSSNDRYANLEVNYLLQRLEEFEGVVVLTTNFASSIDEAFLRRLRFRIQFPLPLPAERGKLWEVMLPQRMPVAADGIDFDWLGSTFDLTGGHIRNAVLRAGMIAVDADKPVSNRMMYEAAAAEYRELGKLAPAYPFDDD